jgi:ABC-type oligopeptide transport system substrate-binding subunit
MINSKAFSEFQFAGSVPMLLAPHAARRLSRFIALGLFLGCAGIVGLAAQPPKEEEDPKAKPIKKVSLEDEDPKGTVKKKIVVDDDPVTTKKAPATPAGNPPDTRLDELVRAAEDARTPALKSLFAKYAVPFDRLNTSSGALRVKPIPVRKSEWPNDPAKVFEVVPQDESGKSRDARPVRIGEVRGVEHFESLALVEAEALIKQKADGTATENLAAAEKLLAAALRYHDYARERQLRRGKEKAWDDIRDPLAAKLREVRLELLRSAIAANDAALIRDASTRLMNAYPKDAAIAQEVARARVAEAERLLASASHIDHLRAKELLDEFDSRFPGAGGEAVRKARNQVKDIALKAFTRAREKKAVGDLTTARDELARASALDPTIEGVREMQRELRTGYPILYVGVRQYPLNMSPSTAKLDSEKQAVELMFEGLLEEVPEENGSVHYRPGVALTMPTAVPGGRVFSIRTYEKDNTGKPGFASHDVVSTWKLLNSRVDTWQAYPMPWLGLPEAKDNNTLRLPFTMGHPDPRALLTFKLLPARWMEENGKAIDDAGFAERPIGTGPFRFYSSPRQEGNNPREMVFVDNVGYGRWKDRGGLPQLREVRFVEVTRIDPISKSAVQAMDPVEAFRTDKLHILTDVPTGELEKFVGSGSPLSGRVQMVTSTTNRRVHILAVNLTRSQMQSKALRQGISMAIDREDILREVFRAGHPEYHKAMTGPYPPNSWANPRMIGGAPPLVNRDLAVARLKTYLADAGAKLEIELLYAIDDPKAEDACRKIKSQVESLTKDAADGRKLILNLVGVPMRELLVRVQEEHGRYDLAYVPFDYPDDWHPFALGAALDVQAAGRGGRNWFNFLVPNTNPDQDDVRLGQMLNELRGYRDLYKHERNADGTEKLVARGAEPAKLFNECLPFIPLWQLDRHMIVHNSLKVYVDDTPNPVSPRLLNQTSLFQGVARWRLE